MKAPQIIIISSIQKLKAVKTMLFILNRSDELKRLVDWAEKKYEACQGAKFIFIGRSYARRDEAYQNKLLILRHRFPKQYRFAWILHRLGNLLSQKPAYYAASASHWATKKQAANKAI
jgi:hypothetical protein